MANVFIDLPVPSSDGTGASTDVSSLGRTRTVTLAGDLAGASIAVEFSNDGGTSWTTALQFQIAGKKTLQIAAEFMRVRVSNANGTVNANCDVGCNDDGTLAVTPDVPAGNGEGAPTDVSALGTFNTFQVEGTFTGTVTLQISQDGIDYEDCVSRSAVGFTNKVFVAQFVRVRRAAVNQQNPGTPVVGLAAVTDATPDGGGGGSPTGPAGGDLSGTYPNPQVSAMTETSGPTQLVIGTISDGQYLRRSGGNLVGDVVLAQRQIATMRLLSDQNSNLDVNDHVEWDLLGEIGPSFVTLSTGAGQANGIASIGSGEYRIAWACRFICNEGAYALQLHDGSAPVVDLTGQLCQSYGDDNVATDACEMPTFEGYFDFASAIDLETRIVLDQNATNITSVYSWWTIERLS